MTTTGAAIPVARGCGTRVGGGIYWELGLGPGGRPVEDFLLDPPQLLPEGMRIPARGVLVYEYEGVTHLIDRVGLKHYPNVADFVEEVRRFGLSRRLPRNLPFEKLTWESRLILVHDRAYVKPINAYDHPSIPWSCPKGKPEHQHPAVCCAGVWWRDLDAPPDKAGAMILRSMPSFDYSGRATPPMPKGYPLRRPAFFMSVPASRLVVVRGGRDEQQALSAAQAAQLSVESVDQ